jgi:hypothetical protein
MCDYSLHNVRSRPAKVGDELVTKQFDSFTTGFAASPEPNVAVCLLPGTEIAFAKEIRVRSVFRSIRNWIRGTRTGARLARFRKIRMDQANVHHDALELPSGETVLLTRLCQGQHATVLQLPAQPARPIEAETHGLFGSVSV